MHLILKENQTQAKITGRFITLRFITYIIADVELSSCSCLLLRIVYRRSRDTQNNSVCIDTTFWFYNGHVKCISFKTGQFPPSRT